ncbi:PaaI family thioesterase [Shewanella baltica]|uniref:PaaI family thioesterase n=1 Tax=Shewanella baltica TaxID=62322 RepID=UPI00217F0DE1|nr:PaaI family thioesterase [Shewanella baltica]MCS6178065.1 PaaI family thioesterase [Shewanella baltica]MCS6254211.1 PaaI family thioesterase [Shewanella baltica]
MNNYQDCKQSHSQCLVCGDATQNPLSLQCKFFADGKDQVVGYHKVNRQLQGYNNLLHGGVASSLVDAAMTHCLFMQGIKALTAEMTVRFVAPIKVGDAIKIVGRIVSQRMGMYQLEASLYVADIACVTAKAKFIQPKTGVIN